MVAKKKMGIAICTALASAVIFIAVLFFSVRELSYRRPYLDTAKACDVELSLVYAVMKAESGFHEKAISSAGAVGLMQLMPATAEFVCRMNDLEFSPTKLTEGEYNLKIGCLYLKYLLNRFNVASTAIAAYNAGEGTVSEWLKNEEYSADGITLNEIPYPETKQYVKKVEKNLKNYLFFYH